MIKKWRSILGVNYMDSYQMVLSLKKTKSSHFCRDTLCRKKEQYYINGSKNDQNKKYRPIKRKALLLGVIFSVLVWNIICVITFPNPH